MKLLHRGLTGMLATWLVAGLCSAGVVVTPGEQDAGREDERRESAPEAAEEPGADGDRATVEDGVRAAVEDKTAARRKRLVADAVEALDETDKALQALEEGDTERALDALAVATGKLDLVVARNPELALAPVDVRLVTHDLYATVEGVKEAREEALKELEEGRLQDARRIVEGLRSDLVLEVANVPLATYPAAIRAVSPLIDEGKVEEAKRRLQRALGTLVVTQHVHPLPVLRTREMLERAEELAETEGRTEEQSERLTELLDDAREQLELAQVLGYGAERDFEVFYDQLDEIARKTRGGKSGTGFFDRIRKALRAFGDSSPQAAQE